MAAGGAAVPPRGPGTLPQDQLPPGEEGPGEHLTGPAKGHGRQRQQGTQAVRDSTLACTFV